MSETIKSTLFLSIYMGAMLIPIVCQFLSKRQEKKKERAMMELAHALQFSRHNVKGANQPWKQ